jgi:lipoyl(octanoyl) transferase
MKFKLYTYELFSSAMNMAIDDLLLEKAVQGEASLRFYGWSKPTISLGYFQSIEDARKQPAFKTCDIVRRSTGGGAIIHHHELTYSLGIPADSVGKEPWPCKMHHLIADVLKTFAVQSEAVVCGEEIKRDPFLCFEHHTAGDLAIGPKQARREKIIGSAQRKQHNAILQHGSILLNKSEFTSGLPGIQQLSGQVISPDRLAVAITNEFCKVTQWSFESGLLSTHLQSCNEDHERIRQIHDEKYANSAWTEKR